MTPCTPVGPVGPIGPGTGMIAPASQSYGCNEAMFTGPGAGSRIVYVRSVPSRRSRTLYVTGPVVPQFGSSDAIRSTENAPLMSSVSSTGSFVMTAGSGDTQFGAVMTGVNRTLPDAGMFSELR